MAKTWKDINYDRMVSMTRIEQAVWDAGEDKRSTVSYQKYAESPELKKDLHEDLVHLRYRHKRTRDRIIYDQKAGKFRVIRRPCFRDQIVHHLLVLELQPYLMRYIIKHNIACIPRRGTEYGRRIIKSWTKMPKRDTRWILQGDVSKYYENARSEILMAFFRSKIRDRRVLDLLQIVVDTFDNGFVLGYYISQWFGAIYLASLDNIIKHQLKIKCYVRYVDNIAIAVSTKKEALQALSVIQNHLKSLGLTLKTEGKECHRIYRWSEQPIDFIGYRTYRDGFQELRKSSYLRFRRSVHRVDTRARCSVSQARSILSRKGIVGKTNCQRLKTNIDATVKKYRMRRIVSNADKQKEQRLAS